MINPFGRHFCRPCDRRHIVAQMAGDEMSLTHFDSWCHELVLFEVSCTWSCTSEPSCDSIKFIINFVYRLFCVECQVQFCSMTFLLCRFRQCVNLINSHSIVGNVIGAEFIRTYFRPESKKKILNMIESIRSSFMTSLGYLNWLDPQTRAYAIKKAHAMHDFLAYPDQLLNDSYVGSLLHGVSVSICTFQGKETDHKCN